MITSNQWQYNEFESIFHHAAIGMAIVSREGHFLNVNQSFCDMLGYSDSREILKLSFQDITHPHDLETDLNFVDKLFCQEIKSYHMRKRYRHRRGFWFWILLSVSAIRNPDGSFKYYIAQIQNIEEQVKNEELQAKLEESEARIELATDSASIGIWEWILETDELIWDKTMYQIYDCNPSEPITNPLWQHMVNKLDLENLLARFQECVDYDRIFDAELRIKTPKQKHKTLRTRGKIMRDDHNRPVRMIGVNWDISDIKSKEQELVQAKEDLLKTLTAKSQFLANMSHEIRTPMSGILGMIELLLLENPNPQQKEYLDTMKLCCDGLLNTINDILDLAKIESGKVQVESDEFSIVKLLTSMIQLHRSVAVKKELLLEFETSLEELIIASDTYKIRQILNNLIGNAIKFTETGKITVQLKYAGTPESPRLEFLVIDTGPGIQYLNLEKIFDPFFQIDQRSNVKEKGTGLGLSISRQLAQLLGGDIKVNSEIGKGSCFTFTLPLKSQDPRHRPIFHLPEVKEVEVGISRSYRYKILVIEDNPVNLKVIISMLQYLGFQADYAMDGIEGLHKAQKEEYDVIFMDLDLPGLTGFEIISRIRQFNPQIHAKIIALTANVFMETRNSCQTLFDYFLAKPTTLKALKNALETLTGSKLKSV